MSFWAISQIIVDIIFVAAIFVLFYRMFRPPKDDPRLSKGLQLLQSKIAVLEDLSDRTEVQVKQLTALMEKKIVDIQAKIEHADQMISQISGSMQKSMEVAKIFQDKIPHEEIIERQNTIKFVKAAKLANQGRSVDEIASQVDIPRGELEFIVKVNRENLSFDENKLPEWIKVEVGGDLFANSLELDFAEFKGPIPVGSRSEQIFEVPRADQTSLAKLGEQFRAAIEQSRPASPSQPPRNSGVMTGNATKSAPIATSRSESTRAVTPQQGVSNPPPKPVLRPREAGIRPVEFQKIEIPNL